jgi:hypothetical protein
MRLFSDTAIVITVFSLFGLAATFVLMSVLVPTTEIVEMIGFPP